jgi:hypothetical protein
MGPAADGLPEGLARQLGRNRKAALKALGNSAVPQVVKIIGRAILLNETRKGDRTWTPT